MSAAGSVCACGAPADRAESAALAGLTGPRSVKPGEAIRTVNHLTLVPPECGRPEWKGVGDLYRVVGEFGVGCLKPAPSWPVVSDRQEATAIGATLETTRHPISRSLDRSTLSTASCPPRRVASWPLACWACEGETHARVGAEGTGRSRGWSGGASSYERASPVRLDAGGHELARAGDRDTRARAG